MGIVIIILIIIIIIVLLSRAGVMKSRLYHTLVREHVVYNDIGLNMSSFTHNRGRVVNGSNAIAAI